MIDVAQKYYNLGYECLPTLKDKRPAVSAWKDIHIDPLQFKSYGIALKAGRASGNIECIDFDNHFGDAKEVISEFMTIEGVKEIYEKYHLPIQSTMSGGFHLLYRCSVVEGNQKLARRSKKDKNGRLVPDVLIETRGEGGYFIVSPTPNYTIVKNNIENIAEITPDERNVLLSAAKTFNTWVDKNYKTDFDNERPGDMFNNCPESINEMISALSAAGWHEVGEGKWRRPDKKDGISATLGKAAKGIFYNFSSSAYPFEQEKGYTAFQVVGLLKYNGDFKTFAKELVEKFKPIESKNVENKEEINKITESKLTEILRTAYINLDIPVAKPPVIMRIKGQSNYSFGYSRVFTLGNFSAITGKSKSKKTFLTSLMITAAVKNGYYGRVFEAELPRNRRGVLLFDTEQSNYDAYLTAHRVYDMLGYSDESFGAFCLREYDPITRCDIIEHAIETMSNYVSYVVIDGIADLAMAINDEVEASRVVSLLMKWTKTYNIHITLVIHQNKNDEYATGHLGSAILKKSECIISVKKDLSNTSRSEVKCDLIRGAADFDPFTFVIDDNGLPVVEDNYSMPNKEERF